jgi:iron complex transport system permease protein
LDIANHTPQRREETAIKPFKNRVILLILACLLLAVVLGSFLLGRYPIAPGEVLGISLSRIFPIEPFWTAQMETVFFNVRLPRILLAGMVGCCLAAAGAAYQGVFQNPMAAPDVLGASSGAAFGAALAIFLGLSQRGITGLAFCFSLLTVLLVIVLGRKVRGNQLTGLILTGMMIHSLFTAGTSYIKLVADPTDQLPAITYWLLGSLAGSKGSDVRFALIPMGIGLFTLLLLRWPLNLLTLGDDEAKTMGLNVRRCRTLIVLAATLVTASSVAVSGMIGWVGLVIPHIARRLTGSNYRTLMPASNFSPAGTLRSALAAFSASSLSSTATRKEGAAGRAEKDSLSMVTTPQPARPQPTIATL